MTCYSEVLGNLIFQYGKEIKKQEEMEHNCRKKKDRLIYRENINILKDRLECLKTLIEYLAGSISDRRKIKETLDILQTIIDVENDLQEYYNAAALECLMKDLKCILY